jgi:hypothetical protein
MSTPRPEPWLRGPVTGIPALLQPAAHAFIMSIEDCEAAAGDLTTDQLWHSPGGAAATGFHLRHLAGSTDRLLTYARGAALDAAQKATLISERTPGTPLPTATQLLHAWQAMVERALAQLAATPESALLDFRGVGRAQLPSNVLGLLFHAAEHASRHTGQVVTTAKMVKSEGT